MKNLIFIRQIPCTTLLEEELEIKDKLIGLGFETWFDWKPDYLYFVMELK
ncbi:hypothetical protein [Anaerobranca gottschalkii]|nr:hypothetical protein [Anaerobranca gottschalkii]